MRSNPIVETIYLSCITYFRMLSVVLSLASLLQHAWIALALSFVLFGLTTWAISYTLDRPTDQSIQALAEAIDRLAQIEEREEAMPR